MGRPKKIVAREVYNASIKILGKVYSATGTTVFEAISNLKPGNCKGMSILTIKHGDSSKDKVITNIATFRLFNTHGISRDIALKNTSLMFQL